LSSRISFSAARRIWTNSPEPPAGSSRPPLDPELAQHGRNDAAVLLQQNGEQMLGHRLRVAALVRKLLRGLQRLLGLNRELV
jgi:hypothetical protein